MSVLRSTSNHLPVKYRCPFKINNALRPAYCMWWSRKDIPVIASPKAAKIVQRLGFTDVRSVAHGTSTEIPGLQAWATVGGRVGPPWAVRENGFVLQELQTGLRWGLYWRCNVDTHNISILASRINLSRNKVSEYVHECQAQSSGNLSGFKPDSTPHAAYLWTKSLLPSTKIQLKLCIPIKSFVCYPDYQKLFHVHWNLNEAT